MIQNLRNYWPKADLKLFDPFWRYDHPAQKDIAKKYRVLSLRISSVKKWQDRCIFRVTIESLKGHSAARNKSKVN